MVSYEERKKFQEKLWELSVAIAAEKWYYNHVPRTDAHQMKTFEGNAVNKAPKYYIVEAGALPETVEIIEVEDVPLAYHPGNTCRVRVKAAGDLA